MLRQSLTSYHTAVNRNSVKPKDPSTVFELENFLSLLGDTLKASEDIAHQSHEILQTFIWLRGGGGGGGGERGTNLNELEIFYGDLSSRVYGSSLTGPSQKSRKAQ